MPEDLHRRHAHRQRCQTLSRARPIGRDAERNVIRLIGREVLPAIGIETVRVLEPDLMKLWVVEAQHCPLGDRCSLVEGNVRGGNTMRNAEERIKPQRLVDHPVEVALVLWVGGEPRLNALVLRQGEQQMHHRLGHLHHSGVEERPLKVERTFLRRETLRKWMGHLARLELCDEKLGQSVPPPHMAKPAALERGDNVIGVADDELPGKCRRRLPKYQLVIEVGPHGHKQIPEANQLGTADIRAMQGAPHALGAQFPRCPPRDGENSSRRAGYLFIPFAGLNVLLMDFRPGCQPVPEEIREGGTPASPVRRRVGVDLLEARRVDELAGDGHALLAVDAREDPRPQPEDRRGKPVRKAGQREHCSCPAEDHHRRPPWLIRSRSRVTSPRDPQPQKTSARRSSERSISKTSDTPSSPATAKPHSTGLPIATALAPSARAFTTSVPRRIPPSTSKGTFPSTDSAISGSSSIAAGTLSSCRPP